MRRQLLIFLDFALNLNSVFVWNKIINNGIWSFEHQ